jgi:hypothetical protein
MSDFRLAAWAELPMSYLPGLSRDEAAVWSVMQLSESYLSLVRAKRNLVPDGRFPL